MGQLTVLVDIDGTISAAPHTLCEVMCALKAVGAEVVIVSGSEPTSPSGSTWQEKANYLKSLGITDCWDQLVVVSGDIPAQKALWCQQHGVSLAIDNNKDNAKAMTKAGVPLVLVPWETRAGGK